MLKIEWLQAARADLLHIIDYIADENPSAALNLHDDIQQKVARLSEFPDMGRVGRVLSTRELVAFANYIVIYQVVPDAIRVLRVLHAAQTWPVNRK